MKKPFALSTTIVAVVVLTSGAAGRSELLNADLGFGQRMFGRRVVLAGIGERRRLVVCLI